MRNISILIINILFIMSCSYQKQENTHQKQFSVNSPNNELSQKDITISMSITDHLKNNFYAIKCDTLIIEPHLINEIHAQYTNDTIFSGYSNTFIEQVDIELYFDEKRAKEIKIEPGWYICDYIAVSLDLSIAQNKKILLRSSERCGFKPGGSGSRGYTIALLNGTPTLYTYVYHIKSNNSKTIDILYPKLDNNGSLSNLEWDVIYI
jgi:hypothetical protein